MSIPHPAPRVRPDDGSAAIRALVSPPALCALCHYERQPRTLYPPAPFPTGVTHRTCPRHAAALMERSRALKAHV